MALEAEGVAHRELVDRIVVDDRADGLGVGDVRAAGIGQLEEKRLVGLGGQVAQHRDVDGLLQLARIEGQRSAPRL